MGAQQYQEQIASRAEVALAATETREWRTDRIIARSTRSPLPGNRRLPLAMTARGSIGFRRRVGQVLYPRSDAVHRMSLELPPSPNADIVTLHDVVAWRFPDESAPVPAATEELRRAAAVICVSEFSAQEAVDLLGVRNPHVVHNGVDERFFSAAPLSSQELSALGLGRSYVLHAGGAATRKKRSRRSRPGSSCCRPSTVSARHGSPAAGPRSPTAIAMPGCAKHPRCAGWG